jgi:hypothetical protein
VESKGGMTMDAATITVLNWGSALHRINCLASVLCA